MITDEQIKEAASCIEYAYSDSLHKARVLLECYENSKWIKFDKNDKSTWPNTEKVLILTENRIVHWSYFDISINGNPNFLKIYSKLVTHWQQLPELPK